jgi:hypothetical protein
MRNFFDQAFEYRLLVLIEDEDYKGFRQIILNKEQFKKVSDAIFTKIESEEELRPGHEVGELQVSEDKLLPIELFEGMESISEDVL